MSTVGVASFNFDFLRLLDQHETYQHITLRHGRRHMQSCFVFYSVGNARFLMFCNLLIEIRWYVYFYDYRWNTRTNWHVKLSNKNLEELFSFFEKLFKGSDVFDDQNWSKLGQQCSCWQRNHIGHDFCRRAGGQNNLNFFYNTVNSFSC